MKAIIDIGSSTTKLSIYENGQPVHQEAVTVNLARNLYPALILEAPAIKDTAEAVKTLSQKATKMGASQVSAFSTGAARKAKNTVELIRAVQEGSGLTLQVISGKEEAKILYQGVAQDFVNRNQKLVVLNVGGNSTELIIGAPKCIDTLVSLPVGVSALNDEFLKSDPPSELEHTAMIQHIKNALKTGGSAFGKVSILVHTGGELDYMQKTSYSLENSNLSPSHPKQISLENFTRRNAEIKTFTKEKLRQFMPQNPRWMDGAIACNAIAEEIAKFFEVEVIVPSNKNLNDGLILMS